MEPVKLLSLHDAGYAPDGKKLLSGITLDILHGRTLALLGRNGSGKSLLAQIVSGMLPLTSGERRTYGGLAADAIGCLSFELQKTVMEEERRNDDSMFMHGALDPGRTVEGFITEGTADSQYGENLDGLLERFNLLKIRGRGLRYLSSGEFRKTLVVRALFRSPRLLVLDDPLDGLDRDGRRELSDALERCRGKLAMMIVSSRLEDLPSWSDSCLVLEGGRIAYAGPAAGASAAYRKLEAVERTDAVTVPTEEHGAVSSRAGILIEMKRVSVRYRDTPVLTDVDWTVVSGEHWRISGPNGSGKSTLLDLVNGDNPKAYGQDITLFGRKKGSGETVWDIKKRIGFVSGALHMKYPPGQRVLGVVLSGLYDSVGLYREPTPVEIETARELGVRFGLGELLSVPFGELSFGLQRVALIARSMIKAPELLILDEPCHGLDDAHTELVLSTAERIASKRQVTLLFVTHDPAHTLPSVKRNLALVPHPEGGYTGIAE